MDTHPDTQWIDERLAVTAPTWEPDALRAGAALEAAPTRSRRRAGAFVLAAATAVVIAAIVAPSAATLAQDLWYRFFATRVAVVASTCRDPARHERAHGRRTGRRRVGRATWRQRSGSRRCCRRRRPAETARLSVIDRLEMTQTNPHRRVRAGPCRRSAPTDIEVPVAWDGVQLRGRVGRMSRRVPRRSRGATTRDHPDAADPHGDACRVPCCAPRRSRFPDHRALGVGGAKAG